MTLSELGSLGELISAFAVLVTLVYLSVQVRQAKIAAETSQAQLRQDSGRALLMNLSDPDLGALAAKANELTGHTHKFAVSLERELGLAPEEAYRLGNWCYVITRYFETYISLESELSRRVRANIEVNFAQPFFRIWWRDGRGFFLDETVARIDEIIREIEADA